MPSIHLDHQATTPVAPEVFEVMRPFFSEVFGSPSSMHQQGLRARDALARAREQVAAFIHAESPEDIIFTSDGTESANLAIKGVAEANQRRGNHIVVSAIEHPSVLGSVEHLEKRGFNCTKVKVDKEGHIASADLKAALTDKTILVAVHHANHDIGTIQSIHEIAEIVSVRGVPLYVDADASAGWLPIDVQALGASLLSFSPHKFFGPKGVGILYRNRRARLNPILHGGIQEGGRRAGVENVPGIVGAGAAAELAHRTLPERIVRTTSLQNRLWNGLRKAVPFLKLNGPELGSNRICANLNISFEFVEGEGLMLMLDTQGIAVASGTSCVSKALKVSHVLAGIGLEHSLAQGSVILSPGPSNTEAEIDAVLDIFPRIAQKLRGMSPMWDEFQRGLIDSAITPRNRTPPKRR